MKNLDITATFALNSDELIDGIFHSMNHKQEVADFVLKLDLRFADVGVTEEIIVKLMESLLKEYVQGSRNRDAMSNIIKDFKYLCDGGYE